MIQILNIPQTSRHPQYPHKRRFLQSFVPSPQEGWDFLTCDRLEFPEQVHGKLSQFPDEKHSLFKVSNSKRRLYDHPGSERSSFVSPVHKDSQKFLQFLWRNKCYTFQGLCFGLNTAPRIFTKILKPIAAFLRKRGVRKILYLDDFPILGSPYQEAQSHTAMAVSLLASLGFTVNLEKSCLILTQIVTFLGFVIDSTVDALSLPQEKVVKVKSLCLKAKVT